MCADCEYPGQLARQEPDLYESVILEPEPSEIKFWVFPPWKYGLEPY